MKHILFAALILLSACSVQNTILLNSDGSGIARGRLSLDETLTNYILDFSDTPYQGGSIFDVTRILQESRERNTFRILELIPEGSAILNYKAEFTSLPELFNAEGLESPIVLEKSGDISSLKIQITPLSFPAFFSTLPEDMQIMLSGLAPEEGERISEEEYLEFIPLLLGEDAVEQVRASRVKLIFEVPGIIIDHSGGAVQGRRYTIEIPLIKLLTLEEDIYFELKYRI
jgi:hypothetical protein